MEQGKLRCDANISIKKKGVKKFGTKTEIKNINSFRNVQKAIESEIKRQHQLLESGHQVEQASLTWNNEKNTAEIMRVKENANDYRYFPDPDLPPVTIENSKIESIKKTLPTLPFDFENKWIDKYDFKPEEAITLASTRHIASYFEEILKYDVSAKNANKWITGELFRLFNEINIPFDRNRILAKDLAKIISLSDSEEITTNSAKEILRKLFDSDKSIEAIMDEEDYLNNTNNNIEDIVNKVLKENPNEVARFQNGEGKLLSYFMGKVMKESKGKIGHKIIIQELNNKLKNS
jgi:aspartyl-tRNA(Asn)/glutamyl-tRNA(Gln) amidotransferase subunit B